MAAGLVPRKNKRRSDVLSAYAASKSSIISNDSVLLDDSLASQIEVPVALQEGTSSSSKVAGTTSQPKEPLHPVIKKALESFQGQMAMGYYQKNQCLDDFHCNSIVEKVVLNCYEYNMKFTRKDLTCLSESLAAIFNIKKEVFYTPAFTFGPNQTHPRGKLFDKQYNVRKKLLKAGLVSRKYNKCPLSKSLSIEGPSTCTARKDISNEEAEQVNWLKTNVQPWSLVQDVWSKTYKARKQDKQNSVVAFLNLYTALRQPHGYTLVEHDFRMAYPDRQHKFSAVWPSFVKAFCVIGRRAIKDKQSLPLLNIVEDPKADESTKAVAVLRALPALHKHAKKLNSKLSFAEIQDSFITTIQTADELKGKIEEMKQLAAAKSIPVQPYMIAQGFPTNMQKCYLVIDDFFYSFDDPLKCIDVAFKTFFAFQTEYPVQSERAWFTIQQAVYDIQKHSSINFPSVIKIVDEIKAEMAKHQ